MEKSELRQWQEAKQVELRQLAKEQLNDLIKTFHSLDDYSYGNEAKYNVVIIQLQSYIRRINAKDL